MYFCVLGTCNSCLLEVWEWAVSESIFCSIWSPAELPPCLELPVISIFFSPTMNFAFFSCLGMETFSIPSLIRIWSRGVSQRLICVNKIRPLKQHLDCWLLKQHLEKQHLDLLSTKGSSTTQTKPAHNLRMLWKWISWSTSSDFSGIWFSFQKNPLDWPLNQKIRKICTLEIKWIKSPIKPPGHHSSEQCGDLWLTDATRLVPGFVIFSTDKDR